MKNHNEHKVLIDTWHRWGSLFIIVVGFLLHYLYDWSGRSNLVAILAPVNESVWEHLKLGTWATVLLILLEYPALRKSTNGYFIAKLASILTLNLLILTIF